ncbi:MAG: polysaccharide pyruvyl transferase family protein [Fibromonadales bacterium]|nr:polysaccharide pyruvyl transferase family protein [Fibromonadales bacterium]
MKSITITLHRSKNYGAFLQAFALQELLGEENVILDYLAGYKELVSEKAKKVPFLWRIKGLYKYYVQRKQMQLKESDLLRKTEQFSNYKQLQNIKPDVFIVGSDQVWGGNAMNFYFLDFANENVRKISYAASKNYIHWPAEIEKRAVYHLQKFHAISVREESFVEYLHSLGLNAVCVCDPTVLHKADFYRRNFNLVNSSADSYVFIYRIRENIFTLGNRKTITVNLQDEKTLVSVGDWLSLINQAEFVLTDSFHCVVFSILFHKQFAVFQNNSELRGMNERYSTILGKTNLEYRVLQGLETEEHILDVVNRPVNWEEVDAILEEWRNYSKNWLMEALK